MEHGYLYRIVEFQSTLPREERRNISFSVINYLLFQSTLPREERQKCRVWLNNQRNFNPRSHERSDTSALHMYVIYVISIHAPTRGATMKVQLHPHHRRFQSTLPREERLHAVYFFHTLQIFQSTLPREERR